MLSTDISEVINDKKLKKFNPINQGYLSTSIALKKSNLRILSLV